MKKTYVFALIAALSMPAFAESNKTTLYGSVSDNTNKTMYGTDTESTENSTVDANVPESVAVESHDTYLKPSNPDIKFPHGMELGLGVSATGGLDGFIGYNNKKFDSFWWKRLGIRLGYASTKPLKSFINKRTDSYMGDGIDIGDYLTVSDGEINAKHMFAVVDFYPFGDTWFFGGLRLSGGYYDGDLNLTADLTSKNAVLDHDAEFKIGHTWYKYTAGDAKGLALAKWNMSGPYAGLGFDIGLFAGLKIYMDAGCVFTSETAKLDLQIVEANLQQSTDNGGTWTPVNIPDLNNEKAVALADAQKKLDKYPYYPIVKLGLMYRF